MSPPSQADGSQMMRSDREGVAGGRHVVRLAAFVSAALLLAPMLWGSRPAHAATTPTSLTEFVGLPGDQVVVVPNGTYKGGGTVNAPHPATDGPYKGWLVLVAQSKGGVTIDMTTSNLTLGPTTNRGLFVGFKFLN